MNAFRNVVKLIAKTLCFSALRLDAERPDSGKLNANQAFSVQANDAMSM